ncbi:serine/threonine protein kinase [Lysobacter sp. HDW10]|uniref:serine/threonine-protein kinase n=1 Tax=Lysobacter sp. HDW10 TaxID=2714936 RepID=UPI00140BFC36|nr:serine/threonine-protein kinase [Lysobacter sp. HDW10]QIK80813.1 serine/threonine protein kinase [Lysobacter sp. HDW10]
MTHDVNDEFEAHALHALREVLELDVRERQTRLQTMDAPLRRRVEVLLESVREDELSESAGAVRAGARMGPYVLISRIGNGGMGEVFLAERADGAYEKRVAVKRIWAGHAMLTSRFLRERELLARLQHPHIAQLLDGGIDEDGRPWLAVELVEGTDIVTWCDAHNAPLTQRVELLIQLCDAVDHAHRQLVVHRDLKPSNVLVDGDGRAKLLDFGIARLLDVEETFAGNPTYAMTPAWASPEQRNGHSVTTASDIYQLGLLAHVLLSGERMDGTGIRMSSRLQREYKRLPDHGASIAGRRALGIEALMRQLRGDLDSIVSVATADDPARRYPSARALADDLAAWRDGRAVKARADERGYRFRRTMRRGWPLIAASALLLGLVGFHLYSLRNALGHTERARARADAAERAARVSQANAEAERNTATAVSNHFIRMFDALGPEAINGRHPATVKQLLKAGADALEKAGASGDQSAEARSAMWRSMASVHRQLGAHAESLAMADKALAAAREAKSNLAIAEALRAKSAALHWLGREKEAFDTTLAATRVSNQCAERCRPLQAKLHDDLAWAYSERGELVKAMSYSRLSIEQMRKDPSAVHTLAFVQALNNAGETAISAGEFDQAKRWLMEGEQRYAHRTWSSPSTGVFLQVNLAAVALATDDIEASRNRLQTLLKTTVETFGTKHTRTDLVLMALAYTTLAAGDGQAAVIASQRLLASTRAVYGEVHPQVLDAKGILLVAKLSAGDNRGVSRLRRELSERCDAPARDANIEVVRIACARVDGNDEVIAERVQALAQFKGVMPWHLRFARQQTSRRM